MRCIVYKNGRNNKAENRLFSILVYLNELGSHVKMEKEVEYTFGIK